MVFKKLRQTLSRKKLDKKAKDSKAEEVSAITDDKCMLYIALYHTN
jgi:hypothetical protein